MVIDPDTGERDYAEERRRERIWSDLGDKAEIEAANGAQVPLSAEEADLNAIVLFAKLDWQDEAHQNRALFRLRGCDTCWDRDRKGEKMPSGLPAYKVTSRRDQEFGRSINQGQKWSKREQQEWTARWRVTCTQLEHIFALTRDRPLAAIADDLWALLDGYDVARRTGQPRDPLLWEKVDALVHEVNGGTSFGSGVNRKPGRLWKAIRIRARAEGRVPMWGVPGRFRLVVRGMHVIYDHGKFGPSFALDTDRHRPGDPSFSETGYRSFSGGGDRSWHGGPDPFTWPPMTLQDYARGLLETYIDQPRGNDGAGGLGGYPVTYIPWQFTEWHRIERDRTKSKGTMFDPAWQKDCPGMTPAKDRPAYWRKTLAEIEAKQADRLAEMRKMGVDPWKLFPDVAPPIQGSLF